MNKLALKTRFCHFERSEKSHKCNTNRRFLSRQVGIEMTVIELFESGLMNNFVMEKVNAGI